MFSFGEMHGQSDCSITDYSLAANKRSGSANSNLSKRLFIKGAMTAGELYIFSVVTVFNCMMGRPVSPGT